MIHLGQPSDLSRPTLRRYVYVVALSHRNTPDLVHFISTEVTARDVDDAYLVGFSSDYITNSIPMDSIVHNDYVHEVKP